MSIEKKSLISILKTAKKANVLAGSELNPKASNITSKKIKSLRKAASVTKREYAAKASDCYLQL